MVSTYSMDDDVQTANLCLAYEIVSLRCHSNIRNCLTRRNSPFSTQAACTCFHTLDFVREISRIRGKNSLSVAGLASTLHGTLVFTEVDEGGGKTSPVGDAREEDLSGLVELVLETFLSDFQHVCYICHG